jgi:hypothetical protein
MLLDHRTAALAPLSCRGDLNFLDFVSRTGRICPVTTDQLAARFPALVVLFQIQSSDAKGHEKGSRRKERADGSQALRLLARDRRECESSTIRHAEELSPQRRRRWQDISPSGQFMAAPFPFVRRLGNRGKTPDPLKLP